MLLSELLEPAAVRPRLKASNKRDAVAELVALLEAAHAIDSQGEILDRVLRREAISSNTSTGSTCSLVTSTRLHRANCSTSGSCPIG